MNDGILEQVFAAVQWPSAVEVGEQLTINVSFQVLQILPDESRKKNACPPSASCPLPLLSTLDLKFVDDLDREERGQDLQVKDQDLQKTAKPFYPET